MATLTTLGKHLPTLSCRIGYVHVPREMMPRKQPAGGGEEEHVFPEDAAAPSMGRGLHTFPICRIFYEDA